MTTQTTRSPAPFKDYYGTMRLTMGATSEDVHRKYRELVREYSMDSDDGVKARLAEVNEAYHVLASRAFRREYDQVWMELAAKPSSILEPENEDEEPTPAPPPPLAVMAKQQARARSPRPKEAPKTRLSVRKFLRAFGLLASFWIIVAVSLATSVS